MSDGPAITIDGREVGPGAPPWIIAELSANHNGSLERALRIVDAAATAGAHALKLQTYTADTMTLDVDRDEFRIDDPDSLWHGYTLHRLYDEAHLPWEWHAPILERCRERGLTAFSSVFDPTSIEFCEGLGMPAYKIASFENTDLPLIAGAAATGKPLIVSSGMASVEQLADVVRTARDAGCRDLLLLKCTSAYPADPADSNLATIEDMRERFGCPVGVSDHTPGIGVAAASVAFGAVAIEKHVTLDRADGGVDAAFSLEPDELHALVVETERAWRARGTVRYGSGKVERGSLKFRRSLYVVEDVAAGETITERHVRSIRPGLGLPPRHLHDIVGRPAAIAAVRGTPVTWDLVGGRR